MRALGETARTLGFLVAVALVGPLACDSSRRTNGASRVSESALPVPDLSARRPTVRFLMERTTDRCEVYWVDGAESSKHADAPCPEEMLLGEKLRLSGMTCILESATEDRRVPVVCPDPLTNLEKAYRKAHPAK